MILPLRRRHRWIVRALLVVILVAAALALTYPAPDARMARLPPQIAAPDATR